MARAPRPPRIHACNVVLDGPSRTRLWSFAGSDGRPTGASETAADQPLPAPLVGKGWAQLLRPRWNVAWLGEQPVFLQLVHLPTDDPREVPAMLELQIEKLSPLPVAQVVWAYEVLPQRSGAGLPVLLVVSERSGVESLLGNLEKRGMETDRVESPMVELVAGLTLESDGAYIISAVVGTRRECLIGWVHEGVLRCLNTVNVGGEERGPETLVDELNRMAWAGEIEGWAPGLPAVHLVADEAQAAAWRPGLESALGMPIQVIPCPGERELAAAGAKRVLGGKARANLLPADFGARFRQQFTDRLWMGGLMAVFGVYLVAVLIYLGIVEVMKFRQGRMASELAEVNTAYTNTLRLKAQTQVLQETVNLRFAALDCWLATVEAMPEELVLEKMAFSGGQSTLQIEGTAPADQNQKITEFWQVLRRKRSGNTNLFAEVQLRPTVQKTVQGVPVIQWSFNCRLLRPEI